MVENRVAAVEKINSDHSSPLLSNCGCREGSGPPSIDLLAKSGDFTGSGFFVEHAFFCRVIDDGLGRVESLDGIPPILSHGEAHILDNVFNPGLNGLVAQAPTLVLAGAL